MCVCACVSMCVENKFKEIIFSYLTKVMKIRPSRRREKRVYEREDFVRDMRFPDSFWYRKSRPPFPLYYPHQIRRSSKPFVFPLLSHSLFIDSYIRCRLLIHLACIFCRSAVLPLHTSAISHFKDLSTNGVVSIFTLLKKKWIHPLVPYWIAFISCTFYLPFYLFTMSSHLQ